MNLINKFRKDSENLERAREEPSEGLKDAGKTALLVRTLLTKKKGNGRLVPAHVRLKGEQKHDPAALQLSRRTYNKSQAEADGHGTDFYREGKNPPTGATYPSSGWALHAWRCVTQSQMHFSK